MTGFLGDVTSAVSFEELFFDGNFAGFDCIAGVVDVFLELNGGKRS